MNLFKSFSTASNSSQYEMLAEEDKNDISCDSLQEKIDVEIKSNKSTRRRNDIITSRQNLNFDDKDETKKEDNGNKDINIRPRAPRRICNISTLLKILAALVFFTLLVYSLIGMSNVTEPHRQIINEEDGKVTNCSMSKFKNFVVSSDSDVCTAVGCTVALQGGNVVDVAIATAFCTSGVIFHSTGISGGGIAVVHSAKTHFDAINSIFPSNREENSELEKASDKKDSNQYKELLSGEIKKNNQKEHAQENILKKLGKGEKNRKKTFQSEYIDFRETAPKNLNSSLYFDKTIQKKFGTGSVGVPGFVKGMHELWLKYGNLEWEKLLSPSVHLLRTGFTIKTSLHNAIIRIDQHMDRPVFDDMREFLMPNGKPLQPNQMMRSPLLADTFEKIGKDPNSFYEGELARNLIKDFCKYWEIEYPTLSETIPCPLTMEDFQEYKPVWRAVSTDTFFDYKTLTTDQPSTGPMFRFMLNVMESILLTKNKSFRLPKSASQLKDIYNFEPQNGTHPRLKRKNAVEMDDYLHYLIEIFKFAYAKRVHLGDPHKIPYLDKYEQTVEYYNSKNEAKIVAKKILENEKTNPTEYYKDGNTTVSDEITHGTSHISVIDNHGNAIALTTTINYYFGSLLRSSSTGVIYNNELDDFSLPNDVNIFGVHTSENNFIEAGRKPLTSMSPIIFIDPKTNKAVLSAGASGGSLIPTATFQVVLNKILFRISASDSVTLPRIHNQLLPVEVRYDEEFPISEEDKAKLELKGHTVISSAIYASVQMVCRGLDDNDPLEGGADPRKNGATLGV